MGFLRVAANLNIKICRISPHNSRSNISERWNRFALMGIKIFHQSYGITDNNYGIILSLISQMLNSHKLSNGYSPNYLMTGSECTFSVLTFQTVGKESRLSEHCQNIIKAQNVCYALQQRALLKTQDHKNPAYDKFAPGTFVLLRKLSVQPRHMMKANPVYHTQPYTQNPNKCSFSTIRVGVLEKEV